jgi:cytochrome c oxidase subunit II
MTEMWIGHETSTRKRGWQSAVAGMMMVLAVLLLRHTCAGSTNHHIPAITIHAKRYRFDPSEITLKQGETVQLIFIADDAPHGITVKGLDLDLELPRHAAREKVLTPSTIGDFAGECSRYCGNGHDRMTFVVHVRP